MAIIISTHLLIQTVSYIWLYINGHYPTPMPLEIVWTMQWMHVAVPLTDPLYTHLYSIVSIQ